MKNGMIARLALTFTLAVVGPVLAEDPAVVAAQDQKAETKNLRTEIVKLKYVRAQDIQQLLYTYASREGDIRFNPNIPTVLVVRDTPENVEKILAAVHEIDVKPADVLFTVQLILGSEADATTDAELQNDPIIKELRRLLRYKGYTLLDSTLVRAIKGARVILGPKAEFELTLQPEVAGDAKAPLIKTQIRLQQTIRPASTGTATMKGSEPIVTVPIESSLNFKPGDRTVVGVSKLDGGDKGLILIISAKIVD
jgi:hypothetical protein